MSCSKRRAWEVRATLDEEALAFLYLTCLTHCPFSAGGSGQDEIPEEISPSLFVRRLGREGGRERGDYSFIVVVIKATQASTHKHCRHTGSGIIHLGP